MGGRFSAGDIQRAVISGLTTETAVVAAPGAGRKVLVLGLCISAAAASVVELETGTTDLNGTGMTIATGIPWVLPTTGLPYYECGDNEALNVTASTAINGSVMYAVVDSTSA